MRIHTTTAGHYTAVAPGPLREFATFLGQDEHLGWLTSHKVSTCCGLISAGAILSRRCDIGSQVLDRIVEYRPWRRKSKGLVMSQLSFRGSKIQKLTYRGREIKAVFSSKPQKGEEQKEVRGWSGAQSFPEHQTAQVVHGKHH